MPGTVPLQHKSGHLQQEVDMGVTLEQQQQLAQLKQAMEQFGQGVLAQRPAAPGGSGDACARCRNRPATRALLRVCMRACIVTGRADRQESAHLPGP